MMRMSHFIPILISRYLYPDNSTASFSICHGSAHFNQIFHKTSYAISISRESFANLTKRNRKFLNLNIISYWCIERYLTHLTTFAVFCDFLFPRIEYKIWRFLQHSYKEPFWHIRLVLYLFEVKRKMQNRSIPSKWIKA